MEARAERRPAASALAAAGRSCRLLLALVVGAFVADGLVAHRPDRQDPPPADEFDVRRVEFQPGEIRDPRDEPAARGPHDRLRDGRRRDRARSRSTAPRDARPPALEHDRRAVRLGRGRADRGRRHELDRDRDRRGDPRRGRDAAAVGARRSSATASSASSSASSRSRSASSGCRRCAVPTRAGWRRSWRSPAACCRSSASRRSSRRSSSRRRCRTRSAAPGSSLLGVAISYLTMTLPLERGSARGGGRSAGSRSRPSSRSGSASTTSARGSRSARSFAFGELALGTFLIVGFMIHNVTEGLGIAAPIAEDAHGASARARLAALALVAGAPAIVGAWIGGYLANDVLGGPLLRRRRRRRVRGRRRGRPLRRDAGARRALARRG